MDRFVSDEHLQNMDMSVPNDLENFDFSIEPFTMGSSGIGNTNVGYSPNEFNMADIDNLPQMPQMRQAPTSFAPQNGYRRQNGYRPQHTFFPNMPPQPAGPAFVPMGNANAQKLTSNMNGPQPQQQMANMNNFANMNAVPQTQQQMANMNGYANMNAGRQTQQQRQQQRQYQLANMNGPQTQQQVYQSANMNAVRQTQQQQQQPANMNAGRQTQQQQQQQYQPANMNGRQIHRPRKVAQFQQQLKELLVPRDQVSKPVSPVTSEHQKVINAALGSAFQEGAASCHHRVHSKIISEAMLKGTLFGINLATMGVQMTPQLSKQIDNWLTANCRFSGTLEPAAAANQIRTEYEGRFPSIFVPGSSNAEVTGTGTATDPLAIPSPTITNSPSQSENGGKSAPTSNSKGKGKAKETFTLTGKSVERYFGGKTVDSFECSDGQYRLLDAVRLKEAQGRTNATVQSSAASSGARSEASGSKRKQQPAGTPERAAKKSRVSRMPAPATPGPSGWVSPSQGTPQSSASAVSVAHPGPMMTPTGVVSSRSIPTPKSASPQQGPVSGQSNVAVPQAASQAAATPTRNPSVNNDGQTASSEAKSPKAGVSHKELIDLTACDDNSLKLKTLSYEDRRMVEILRVDKGVPVSVMKEFLTPTRDSPFEYARLAAENKEGDVSHLLFDEWHRIQAYKTYDSRSNQGLGPTDVKARWEKEQREDREREAQEQREAAAANAALEAHAHQQPEAPQVQSEAAQTQARIDEVIAVQPQQDNVAVEGPVVQEQAETEEAAQEDFAALAEAETDSLFGDSDEAVVEDAAAQAQAETEVATQEDFAAQAEAETDSLFGDSDEVVVEDAAQASNEVVVEAPAAQAQAQAESGSLFGSMMMEVVEDATAQASNEAVVEAPAAQAQAESDSMFGNMMMEVLEDSPVDSEYLFGAAQYDEFGMGDTAAQASTGSEFLSGFQLQQEAQTFEGLENLGSETTIDLFSQPLDENEYGFSAADLAMDEYLKQ